MPATTSDTETPQRRLTRARVVDAAIELLDDHGANGLTFRALAQKLKTGHGAIQWHVANKAELLVAATTGVLTEALATLTHAAPPREVIRSTALGFFDAIENHPWLGPQLFAAPWQPAMVQLWDRLGRSLDALGVPERSLFTAVSTLVSYVVGVGSQNALNSNLVTTGEGRHEFLGAVADRWASAGTDEDSFIPRLAAQLRAHDDRTEFVAGIDIIIAGTLSLS